MTLTGLLMNPLIQAIVKDMRLKTIIFLLGTSSVQAAVINNHFENPLDLTIKPVIGDDVVDSDQQNPDLDLLKQLQLKAQSQLHDPQRPIKYLAVCESCHAGFQNRSNSYLPVLQGQNLEYLFSKILMFKNNPRSFHPYPGYIQRLSPDDIMDISLYYANQSSDLNRSMVSSVFSVDVYSNDEPVTFRQCADCHGLNGKGEQLIPAISGQNKNYLSFRIREISSHNSRVHNSDDAPVSCTIPDVNITASHQLAMQLSLVLDDQRVTRGRDIYSQSCARCHDTGMNNAPKLGDKKSWSNLLRLGIPELVKSTIAGKNNRSFRERNFALSRNQLTDAIHYMIKSASSKSE